MKLGSIRKENYGPIAAAVNVVAGAVVYFFGADNGNTLAVAMSISLTALAFCLLGTGLAIAALVANKKSDIFAWIALFIAFIVFVISPSKTPIMTLFSALGA